MLTPSLWELLDSVPSSLFMRFGAQNGDVTRGWSETPTGSELWIRDSNRQLGSTVVCWGLWLCWHSGGSVVWEQLSHSAPAERAHGTRLVGCLIASMCVLCEYLCRCAFVWRYARGRLFVPQTVYPLLSQSHTGSLFFVTWCLFPLSRPSVQCWSFRRPQPSAPLSVLPAALLSHFTPACHIPSYLRGGYIPLPWEAATSKRLAFLVVKPVGRWSVKTNNRAGTKQEIGMFVYFSNLFSLQTITGFKWEII